MPSQPYFDRLITLQIPGQDTGDVNQHGHPIFSEPEDRKVWATRLDSPAKDDLSVTTDRTAEIRERRYRIRLENAAGVVTDLTDIDEDGKALDIRG